MKYFDKIDWLKLKKDVGTGLEKGVIAAKKGALVVKKGASDLSEEGKRQYKIMTLKSRVHSQIADLGARVYSLMGKRGGNPGLDATVKDIVTRIRKDEARLAALHAGKKGPMKKAA